MKATIEKEGTRELQKSQNNKVLLVIPYPSTVTLSGLNFPIKKVIEWLDG